MQKAASTFSYKTIIEKSFCITLLEGELTNKSQTDFNSLLKELESLKCATYIFKLNGIKKMDRSAHRMLIKMQLTIREDLNSSVRFCELRQTYKTELLDFGIIKATEYYNSLKEALIGGKEHVK